MICFVCVLKGDFLGRARQACSWLCELGGGLKTFLFSFIGMSQGVDAGIHHAQLKALPSLD